MINNNKKVILINGNKSNWYEQVIFILKSNKESNIPLDLVCEAEKIINDYMSKRYPNKTKESYSTNLNNNSDKNIKSKKFKSNECSINNLLNASIFLCIVLIGFLIYKIIF